MATTGKAISKDLAMIKGQLAATKTRLQSVMLEYGNELLQHDSGQETQEVSMGIHICHLLLKLEIYQEHVDKFTSSVRKKYGMPELKIRRDTHSMRTSFMKSMKELQDQIQNMTAEELKNFMEVEMPAS